jgi:hypothetical protein
MAINRDFFCAALSREAGESKYGTAERGRVWLLLEYSKPWNKEPFIDSELSANVKRHIEDAIRILPKCKVLFIKRDRERKELLSFFVIVCQELKPIAYQIFVRSYEELTLIDIPALVFGQIQHHATIVADPILLVCTHGRRDKCCAKYGIPIYRTARIITDDKVWQSSHVGGDRFAANVVCFPHGLFYGHVDADNVKDVIDSYTKLHVHLPNYRGRACYTKIEQVAEFFVRRESGITDLGDLYLKEIQAAEQKQTLARFISINGQVTHEVIFQSEMSEFQNFLACNADEQKRVAQYKLLNYSTMSLGYE